MCILNKKLEEALENVSEKDISVAHTIQQVKKTKDELNVLQNAFETVSAELQRVKMEVGKCALRRLIKDFLYFHVYIYIFITYSLTSL